MTWVLAGANNYITKILIKTGLSGGEKQRIGIARAFLHDAPLLLLDEPTSNLDSLNEGIILKSLKESARQKTVVLVSHRASNLLRTNDCSALPRIFFLVLWPLLTSCRSLLLRIFFEYVYLNASARPPRVLTRSFPLYLPHLP